MEDPKNVPTPNADRSVAFHEKMADLNEARMGEGFEYEEAEKPEPSSDKLEHLIRLAKQADAAQRLVDRLEVELKEAKGTLTRLVESEIPTFMDDLETTEIRNSRAHIKIAEKVYSKFPKARANEAVAWLDDHGFAGMVKRLVTIAFNREEQKLARKLMADIKKRKTPLRVDEEQWVEPGTLTAWVKRQLEEGTDIPKELFGVYTRRVAEVAVVEEG